MSETEMVVWVAAAVWAGVLSLAGVFWILLVMVVRERHEMLVLRRREWWRGR